MRTFHYAPRYCRRIPVPTETTLLSDLERLAREEERRYQLTLTGVFGPEERSRAESEGLEGIAVVREHIGKLQDRKTGRIICPEQDFTRDLITGTLEEVRA